MDLQQHPSSGLIHGTVDASALGTPGGLPPDLWPYIMEYLSSRESVQLSATSKFFLGEAVSKVKKIHILRSGELNVQVMGRFTSVEEIRIFSILNEQTSENVDEETAMRVASFLGAFAKLKRVLFGTIDSEGVPTLGTLQKIKWYSSHNEECMKTLVTSMSGGFQCHALSQQLEVIGLYCLRRGEYMQRECKFCNMRCQHFPVESVNETNYCLSSSNFEQIIESRPGGHQFLTSEGRLLQILGAPAWSNHQKIVFGGRFEDRWTLYEVSYDTARLAEMNRLIQLHVDITLLELDDVSNAIMKSLTVSVYGQEYQPDIKYYLDEESFRHLKDLGLPIEMRFLTPRANDLQHELSGVESADQMIQSISIHQLSRRFTCGSSTDNNQATARIVIDSGVVLKLVHFLRDNICPTSNHTETMISIAVTRVETVYDTADILSSVSCYDTKKIFEAGAGSHLVHLLSCHDYSRLCLPALRTVSNMLSSSGSTQMCESLLADGLLLTLLNLLKVEPRGVVDLLRDESKEIEEHATKVFGMLCDPGMTHGKALQKWFFQSFRQHPDVGRGVIKRLENLLFLKNNHHVVVRVFQMLVTLRYMKSMTPGAKFYLIIRRLVELLSYHQYSIPPESFDSLKKIRRWAHEFLSHFTSKYPSEAKWAICEKAPSSSGQCLLHVLAHGCGIGCTDSQIHACDLLSEMILIDKDNVQSLIDNHYANALAEVLANASCADLKKSVIVTIKHMITSGSSKQVSFLVDQGCLQPLCDLLVMDDVSILTSAVDTLSGLHLHPRSGQAIGKKINNDARKRMIDLLSHESVEVHTRVLCFISGMAKIIELGHLIDSYAVVRMVQILINGPVHSKSWVCQAFVGLVTDNKKCMNMQALVDHNVVIALIKFANDNAPDSNGNAALALRSIIQSISRKQAISIVTNGCTQRLGDLLMMKDVDIIFPVLDAMEHVLSVIIEKNVSGILPFRDIDNVTKLKYRFNGDYFEQCERILKAYNSLSMPFLVDDRMSGSFRCSRKRRFDQL